MNTSRSSSKSGLFLIELIIAIVFFAVASAICIQLFVKAHLISTRSTDISTASIIAQNTAEQFKADSANITSGQMFDANGNKTDDPALAVYIMQCNDEEPYSLALSVYKYDDNYENNKPVFELQVANYTEGSKATS